MHVKAQEGKQQKPTNRMLTSGVPKEFLFWL